MTELAANITRFARTLRAAGLPMGPGRILDAIEAAGRVGIRRRQDLYHSLQASLLTAPEQRVLFDQAFRVYFDDPRIVESLMSLLLPGGGTRDVAESEQLARRLMEALGGRVGKDATEVPAEIEIDAAETCSDTEQLRDRDFEQMSVRELEQARRLLREAVPDRLTLKSRRRRPDRGGPEVDMAALMRGNLRPDRIASPLPRQRPQRRPMRLVLLCDISGSMGRYSRMFLHYAHTLTAARRHVETFLFATRLTPVTRLLRHRDIDIALQQVSSTVRDWSGGTRIGDCIREFNFVWARRLLGQGAVVVLLTDGLERDTRGALGPEMARLHRSSRRLVWLNPLLRFRGFEPRAAGVRTMLPHVDEFRSAHNVDSLLDLAQRLD